MTKRTEVNNLRVVLVDRYGDLRTRLARRLGSLDSAEDALQDTYIRLETAGSISQPDNPVAYLFKAALNTALNRRRSEIRLLKPTEIEALLHIADEAPGALQIIEGRADLEKLKQAMSELPPRQQAILLAARLDGLSRKELAERFGISVSMVEKELRAAQIKCLARFRRRS